MIASISGALRSHRFQVLLRYGMSGAVVFAFNMGLAAFLFSFQWTSESDLHTNAANVLATEVSFIFSFFFHNFLTWRQRGPGIVRRFVHFHLVAAAGLAVRFILFALMIAFDASWLVSTLLSIGCQMFLNFVGFDRLVFSLAKQPLASAAEAYAADGAGVLTLDTLEEAVNYNRYVLSKIAPSLGASNLELGAGRGTISALVAETHTVILCELSQDNLRALRERFRGSSRVRAISEDFFRFKQREFDCIYSANVLEHIEDDERVLEHACELLTPGGRFVAYVPAGMWLYSSFDRKIGHYRRYTRQDVRRLRSFVKERGLPLQLKWRYMNLPGALGWFIRMRLLKASHIDRRSALVADRLVGLFAILDRLPLPLGQNMLLEFEYGRKQ